MTTSFNLPKSVPFFLAITLLVNSIPTMACSLNGSEISSHAWNHPVPVKQSSYTNYLMEELHRRFSEAKLCSSCELPTKAELPKPYQKPMADACGNTCPNPYAQKSDKNAGVQRKPRHGSRAIQNG